MSDFTTGSRVQNSSDLSSTDQLVCSTLSISYPRSDCSLCGNSCSRSRQVSRGWVTAPEPEAVVPLDLSALLQYFATGACVLHSLVSMFNGVELFG
jgi:hypothetical protein